MLVWKLIVLPVREANLRYTRIIKQEMCTVQEQGSVSSLREMIVSVCGAQLQVSVLDLK